MSTEDGVDRALDRMLWDLKRARLEERSQVQEKSDPLEILPQAEEGDP